jgi:signal peptidase I
LIKVIRRLLFLIGLAVGITWVLRTFFFDMILVASGSMEPTLAVGDHYVVNRLTYRFRDPDRGDIIVFRSPVDGETGFIKRVIAVGGDTVELRDKHVILNGKPLEEPYTEYKRAKETLDGDNLGPLQVPEGSVFVLGDDRDESFDSTTWKDPKTGTHIYFLPNTHIKGKLIQIL